MPVPWRHAQVWHLSRGEKEAPPLGDPGRVGRSGEREITLGVIDSNQMPGYTSESSAWFEPNACAERSGAQGLLENMEDDCQYTRSPAWEELVSTVCCTFSIPIHIREILYNSTQPTHADRHRLCDFNTMLVSTLSRSFLWYAKNPVLPSVELLDH